MFIKVGRGCEGEEEARLPSESGASGLTRTAEMKTDSRDKGCDARRGLESKVSITVPHCVEFVREKAGGG